MDDDNRKELFTEEDGLFGVAFFCGAAFTKIDGNTGNKFNSVKTAFDYGYDLLSKRDDENIELVVYNCRSLIIPRYRVKRQNGKLTFQSEEVQNYVNARKKNMFGVHFWGDKEVNEQMIKEVVRRCLKKLLSE